MIYRNFPSKRVYFQGSGTNIAVLFSPFVSRIGKTFVLFLLEFSFSTRVCGLFHLVEDNKRINTYQPPQIIGVKNVSCFAFRAVHVEYLGIRGFSIKPKAIQGHPWGSPRGDV